MSEQSTPVESMHPDVPWAPPKGLGYATLDIVMGDDDVHRKRGALNPDDIEKQRSIEGLKDIGVLVSFSDTPTYHGYTRKVDETDDWKVLTIDEQLKDLDTKYAEADDNKKWRIDMWREKLANGGNNAYDTPCLYAAKEPDARRFAELRLAEDAWPFMEGLIVSLVRELDATEYFLGLDDAVKLIFGQMNKQYEQGKLDGVPTKINWPAEGSYDMIQAVRMYKNSIDDQQLDDLERTAVIMSGLEVAVAEIAAYSKNATLFDVRRLSRINYEAMPEETGELARDEDIEIVSRLIKEVAPDYTQSLPAEVQDGDNELHIQMAFDSFLGEYITVDDVQKISDDLGMSLDTVEVYAEAYNAQKYFIETIQQAVQYMLIGKGSTFSPEEYRDQGIKCSKAYIKHALKEMGVVGIISDQKSATMNMEVIEGMVTIFELEAVDRIERVEA